MADTTKSNKPRIKVEEVEDTPEEVSEETKPTTTEPDNLGTDKTTPPKVASFSQLDTAPPAPPEDKKTSELLPETESMKSEPAAEEKSIPKEEEQISSDEVKEWLKEVRPDTTKENEKGRGPGAKTVVIIVVVLLLLGALVGGVLYFQKGVGEEATQPTNTTSETTPSVTPVPTQVEEEVDLKQLSVSVLNGSGKAGEAGKVEDLLVESGFSEDKITTGNADSYDYEETAVSLKVGLSAKVMDAVKISLTDVYALDTSGDELEENSSYDIVIIVGSKKAE